MKHHTGTGFVMTLRQILKPVPALTILWIVLWCNFILRDLFIRDHISDYKALIVKNAEGKRSYTYGDRFYGLLKFAKSALPPAANYGFSGVEELSLEHRRAVYYMYPFIEEDEPDYVLVYDQAGHKRAGYALYRELDGERYILKKLQMTNYK